MKQLLLLIVLGVSLSTYSQARLNYSKAEIIEEYKGNTMTSGYPKEPWVSFDLGFCSTMYIFDKDGLCEKTIIVPNDEDGVAFFINKYNKELVTLSPGSWVMVTSSNNFFVDFMKFEDGGYYFDWHE
jgi:hypothetical protein